MFFLSHLAVKCYTGYYKSQCPLKMKRKVMIEEKGDICCIPSRLSHPPMERNSQRQEWLERNTEGAAGCERRGAVKWEMVVIAWCASVNSAVISHTTCCCDLPGAPCQTLARHLAAWNAYVPLGFAWASNRLWSRRQVHSLTLPASLETLFSPGANTLTLAFAVIHPSNEFLLRSTLAILDHSSLEKTT